jgi:hypothetical protein
VDERERLQPKLHAQGRNAPTEPDPLFVAGPAELGRGAAGIRYVVVGIGLPVVLRFGFHRVIDIRGASVPPVAASARADRHV